MKKSRMVETVLAFFLLGFLLTGCGSMRFATTLKPESGMEKFVGLDDVKFSLVQLNTVQDKKSNIVLSSVEGIKITDLKQHVSGLYPGLLGNDFSDIPVYVDVDAKCSNSEWGAMLTGFTMGAIPFPVGSEVEYKVHTQVPGVNGSTVNETVSFTRTDKLWLTITSPLGLLPVLGRSDLPRVFIPLDLSGKIAKARSEKLTMDSLTEAVVRSIRQADPDKLKVYAKSRKSRIRQVSINGQTFWSFLGFSYIKSKDQHDVAGFYLYREYPTWGAKPIESVVVAKRKDVLWQPVSAYLRSVKELTAATVILENGRPSKVVIKKVDEPPLEDFIDLPQTYTANDLRWSNGILIEVKNSTLPLLIREKSRGDLTKLITRIEKAMLNLNERAQMADSQIQQIVANKGDPNGVREISVLYNQRIAIFGAILSALKRSVARSK